MRQPSFFIFSLLTALLLTASSPVVEVAEAQANGPSPIEAFLQQGCEEKRAEACKDLGLFYHELGRKEDSRSAFKRGCDLGSRVACRMKTL